MKIAPRTETTAIKLMPTRALLSPTRAIAELPDAPLLPVEEVFPVFVPPLPAVGAGDGVKTALGLAMQELAAELADALGAAALFTVPFPAKLQAVAVRPLSS